VENCPDGVIGAGDGYETVTNLETREVAKYHYQYAIYNFGIGANLGKIKYEKHAGFARGLRELGFEGYSGLFTCRASSLTNKWKVLGIDSVLLWQQGGAFDLEIALCGPGPIGPFEGVPDYGSQEGIWTLTMGTGIYLTAFAFSTPTGLLALYGPPQNIHKATDQEWNETQRKMRDPR
jgi:hypothetical protein